jgi:hypothetical protein
VGRRRGRLGRWVVVNDAGQGTPPFIEAGGKAVEVHARTLGRGRLGVDVGDDLILRNQLYLRSDLP